MSFYGCCCACTPDPYRHKIAGCPCTNISNSVFVSCSPNVAYFQSTTLTWGPTPDDISSYLGWGPGSSFNPGYSSPKMTNPTDGSTFRYVFYCDHTGFYRVDALITSDSPASFPGPANIAEALVGLPGNTCGPPLALHNMSVFLRGETVTVDGT